MTAYGITDRGKVRQENQDSFRLRVSEAEDTVVCVLCDGMGGERAGSTASALAADAFMSYAGECLDGKPDGDVESAVREAAAYANVRVFDRACTDEKCSGMGTTLVGAAVRGDTAVIVNVGDSRCYWLTEGGILQITRDHSLVQTLVDRGVISQEEARSHPRKNIITKAIGLSATVRSDIFLPQLSPGETLLFCSDGLSNVVSEQEINDILRETQGQERACTALLNLALERGAPDNVTILLLRR